MSSPARRPPPAAPLPMFLLAAAALPEDIKTIVVGVTVGFVLSVGVLAVVAAVIACSRLARRRSKTGDKADDVEISAATTTTTISAAAEEGKGDEGAGKGSWDLNDAAIAAVAADSAETPSADAAAGGADSTATTTVQERALAARAAAQAALDRVKLVIPAA